MVKEENTIEIRKNFELNADKKDYIAKHEGCS